MWKHYGDPDTGEQKDFLADGSQDKWITENLIPISDEIADKLRNREINKFINNEWVYIENRTLEERISEINLKAQNEITFLYPDWKQANITADYIQYSDNEIFKEKFENMRLYINQIRAYADLEVILLG